MTASFPRRLWTTVLPFAVAAVAACSESTPFDPVLLSQNTDEIINAMDDSPAMQSMDVLGEKMTVGAPAMGAPSLVGATLPNVALTAQGFPAWAAGRLQTLQATLPAFTVAAPEAVIPTAALGKTFTYNTATNSYQLSDRTGAPSNGVRFILYAVNPVTHTVVTPLSEVGYVDLLDESSGSTVQLHLKAYITASGTTPLIDYTASATIQGTPTSPTGATVTASGHVSNGTTTVEFSLSQTFSTTSGIDVDYTLAVPEKDVEVTFSATFTLTQQATVTLTVKNGGNTTVVAASGTIASITGTIKHNGDLVVNITGSPENPTFTRASGEQLTAEQTAALKKLFDFTDKLLDHVDEMLAPAHQLLGIAALVA